MLKTEIRQLIKSVNELLGSNYGHSRVLELLSKENRRLREDNRRLVTQSNKLMDRLMARNFESYATYKEDEGDVGPFSIGSKNEPFKDESIIGEVVEE